jgi:hypothetical protein
MDKLSQFAIYSNWWLGLNPQPWDDEASVSPLRYQHTSLVILVSK